MTGVYYPYLQSQKKWEELRYSLRSLEKFFMEENYEVWIVGDLPEWAVNVRHIPHVKNERLVDSATCDAISKLSTYIHHPDTPEEFIRMYDDIYLIGPRTLEEMKVTRYLFTYEEVKNRRFTSGCQAWRDDVKYSVEGAKEKGYAGIMTETHCPEVFEKTKMRDVFEIFNPFDNRLLTSTLYYNVYPYPRMLKDRKTERALFYGFEHDFGYATCNIKEAVQGKYYLNHNNAGLDTTLMGWIEKSFPVKSRWER